MPLDQLRPQVRPLSPPLHCSAAATAEVARTGVILAAVYGAIFVVAAIQRVRNALKENMSVVHLSVASQATSYAIPPGKKVLSVVLRSPSTLPFQISLPLVCSSQ